MESSEVLQSGRNFRLLDEEELPKLLDFLKGYLPESLKFHQTLLTYMRDKVWDFNFYVPDGWPKNPICLHFPGMTLSPHDRMYESFGVFCPSDRLDLLQLVREEDQLIDWSRPLYINFVHIDIAEELMRLYESMGTIDTVVADVWACDLPKDMEDAESGPDDLETDVQVLPLKAEHAEGIHELYPANDMECHEVFLRLIRTLPAAGVFANGHLAAWMIQSYYGAMFSMQTKPEYRRKGYGTRLARYLTKRVADRGYHPFVVIRPDNEASQSLYRKLGFRKLYQTVRMSFTPNSWQDDQEMLIMAVNDVAEGVLSIEMQGEQTPEVADEADEGTKNVTCEQSERLEAKHESAGVAECSKSQETQDAGSSEVCDSGSGDSGGDGGDGGCGGDGGD